MTLVSEVPSGCEWDREHFASIHTLLKKYGVYQGLTGARGMLSVAVCATVHSGKHTHTHTHMRAHTRVIVTREGERRSYGIGYQVCPLLSSVRLQPVTLDHHIFTSDV